MMIMIALLASVQDNNENIILIFFLINYAWDIHAFGGMDLHYKFLYFL